MFASHKFRALELEHDLVEHGAARERRSGFVREETEIAEAAREFHLRLHEVVVEVTELRLHIGSRSPSVRVRCPIPRRADLSM